MIILLSDFSWPHGLLNLVTYMDLFSSSICSFTLFSILYPLIILYNTVFGFLEKNWIFYLFKRVKYSSYLLTLAQNYFILKFNWEYKKIYKNNIQGIRYAAYLIIPHNLAALSQWSLTFRIWTLKWFMWHKLCVNYVV